MSNLVVGSLTDPDIIKYQQVFDELLHIGKFWFAIMRDLWWSLMYQLLKLVDALSGGQKAMTKLLGFFQSEEFLTFSAKYEFITWSLGALGILFLFYKLVSIKKRDTDTVLNNFIIAIVMSLALPMLMGTGFKLFSYGRDFEQETTPVSLSIVQNNVTDLYRVDINGWKDAKEGQNDLKKKDDLKYIDMSEVVDTGGWFFDDSPLSDTGKDILSKKTVQINNKLLLANLESKVIGSDEAYFRYSWHPFIIFFELCVFLVIYLFFLFKFSYLALESGVLLMFFNATAFTDLSSGKRNILVLDKIKNIFIVGYFMLFMQSILVIYFNYINQQDLAAIWAILAKLGGAFLCIQGPHFIEQLFGIEGGSGNMAQSFMAMKQGMDGLGSLAKGAVGGMKTGAKAVGGLAGGAGKGGLYTGAALKGGLDGFKASKSDATAGESGSNKGSGESNPLTSQSPSGGKETKGTDSAGGKGSGQPPKGKGSGADNELSPLNPSSGNGSGGTDSESPKGGGSGQPDGQPLNPLAKEDGSGADSESPSSDNGTSHQPSAESPDTFNPLSGLGQPETSHNSTPTQTDVPQSETSHPSTNSGETHSRKDDTVVDVVKNGVKKVGTTIVESQPVKKANRIYDVSKNTVKQVKGRETK